MRRIASGTTDQYVYFQRQTGLDTFTVYRSRNGAAWAAMTTPTITEGDSVNAPGIYQLLLDEDMTIGAGNVTEHMAFYVTHAGMTAVFLEVELFADIASTIDGKVDAIQAQTDQLAFTVAGQVDANIQSINDVTITGDGQTGTEFGV